MRDSDVIIIIISLIVFFFLLGGGITIFVLFYYRKRLQYIREKEEIKQNFERTLLESQLEIQQQTFNTISQEIHDNVGQILSLCKVQLNIIEKTSQELPTLFSEVKDNITKALSDLRDIAKSINTDKLQTIPFSKVIEEDTQRINRTNLIKATVLVRGQERVIEAQKTFILYRVIQEALQNILKHSEATEISIVLDYSDGALSVTINDNGRGFEVNKESTSGKGIGLQNMFARVKLIGGQLHIDSTEEGTKLFLNISQF